MFPGAGPCSGERPCPNSVEPRQLQPGPRLRKQGERASLLQEQVENVREALQLRVARGGKRGRKSEGKLKDAAFLQLLKKLKIFIRLLREREEKRNRI